MPAKIAYILSRFPKISETFILREINTLEDQDWEISLYPLILEKQAVVHPEAKPWLEKLHYFPWISVDVARANIRTFWRAPFAYLKLWGRTMLGNGSNFKFLVRAFLIFPKAVRMAEEMQQGAIQHIHAHFATHPALTAWIINQLTGISYSVTTHAHDIYVTQTMLKEKMQAATFIITISEFNRIFLIKHIGKTIEEKINIIHCGIEPTFYAGTPSLPSDDVFYIKSIGSLQDYKGMRYLITACALLVEKGIPLHCEIIGEGEERSHLEALIKEKNLEKVVHLAGAKTQKEVARTLKSANCYVQPSVITKTGKMEGIPVSIMEALGSGLPVVASDISGISELVQSGKTGYLVPERVPEQLAETLAYIFQHPEEALKFAQNGQELVAQEYNLNKNSARVAFLFERFLNSQTK